jgi:hypothetical protein
VRSKRVASTQDVQREYRNNIPVLFVGEESAVFRPISISLDDL